MQNKRNAKAGIGERFIAGAKRHWKELSAVLIITSGPVMVPGIRLSANDWIADRLL